MTGRLVDTHLGNYDCKLNTIVIVLLQKIKYILNVFCFVYLFLFFFILGFVMYKIAVR